jgi:hypothetical protein
MSPHTHRRTRIALLVAIIIVILLLLTRCALESSTPGAERASGSGADRALTGHRLAFSVTGHTVRPISPGVSAAVNLVLTNPHGFPLTVREMSLSIRDVVAPHADEAHPCTVGDFTLTQARPHTVLDVPANGTTSLRAAGVVTSDWPRVGMTAAAYNQDGCKGATLRFDNTASGRRVAP